MDALPAFEPPMGEALSLLESPAPGSEASAKAGARLRRFELSCRGDRVPLELVSPDSGTSPALLLVQPAPAAATALSGVAGLERWLSAGISVASITLPLFGSRRSPKMTELLEQTVADSAAGRAPNQNARILWQEFTRQSVLELRRALDALEALRGDAHGPVVFAAAGLAASVGAIFYAVDSRPVAAVLAGTGLHGPEGVDPSPYLDEIHGGPSPRPLESIANEEADLLEAAWPFLSAQLKPKA